MIKFEVSQNLQDERLRPWNELWVRCRNPLPFQRYEWVINWWQNFSVKKDRLFIILAYEDSELIGIAPLRYRLYTCPLYTSLRFIGTGYFDYFDFIIKKGLEYEVAKGFLSLIDKEFNYFELELKNIFQDSQTFKILQNETSLNYLYVFQDEVPYIELPKDKQKFFYQIKGTLRWDVTRREKRLRELGDLEFKSCSNMNEAKETLEDFFNLHIKRWELTNGYSAFKFEKMRRFMRGMLELFFPEKIMNLFYLLHNEQKKVAICPGFETASRFIFYTHTYDPEFVKCSPGKVLVHKLINYSIEKNYTEFDFGIGKEQYKLEWPCQIKRLYDIYVFKDKNTIFNNYLKFRRYIISSYFLHILPVLRKFVPLVYAWRCLNRRRANFRRFQ